ncbi:MAG: J domain-containing protein [Gammaproteobacteria bacterium]|nr:J domain-containing protein [Gammaproteobacteria bacterium]
MSFWDVLGIAPTDDQKTIKRAYAHLLKVNRPDQDPAAYQALREAFDAALKQAKARTARSSVPSAAAQSSTDPPQSDHSLADPPPALDPPTGHRHDGSAYDTDLNGGAEALEGSGDARRVPPNHYQIPHPVQPHSDSDAARAHGADCAQCVLTTLCDSEADAIEQLRAVLRTDDLLHLDVRAGFESRLATALRSWPKPYPLGFAAEVCHEFIPDASLHTGIDDEDDIHQLATRVNSARRFAELNELSQRRWSNGFLTPYVARLLVNDTEPARLPRAARIARVRTLLKAHLQALKDECPAIFEFDMNPQVVSWWTNELQTLRFATTHLIIGLVVALIPAWLTVAGTFRDTFDLASLGVESMMPAVVLVGITISVAIVFSPIAFGLHLGGEKIRGVWRTFVTEIWPPLWRGRWAPLIAPTLITLCLAFSSVASETGSVIAIAVAIAFVGVTQPTMVAGFVNVFLAATATGGAAALTSELLEVSNAERLIAPWCIAAVIVWIASLMAIARQHVVDEGLAPERTGMLIYIANCLVAGFIFQLFATWIGESTPAWTLLLATLVAIAAVGAATTLVFARIFSYLSYFETALAKRVETLHTRLWRYRFTPLASPFFATLCLSFSHFLPSLLAAVCVTAACAAFAVFTPQRVFINIATSGAGAVVGALGFSIPSQALEAESHAPPALIGVGFAWVISISWWIAQRAGPSLRLIAFGIGCALGGGIVAAVSWAISPQ